MRKIWIMAALLLVMGCNTNQSKEIESSTSVKEEGVENPPYPYSVSYSHFAMGDIKHTQTVLEIWKLWDANELSKQRVHFADSFEFFTADGFSEHTSQDSAFALAQSFRNNFTSVKSSVSGIVSFTALENKKRENWVAVWGDRVSTDKSGKTDTVWIHEAWQLNDDGKLQTLVQFTRPIKPK